MQSWSLLIQLVLYKVWLVLHLNSTLHQNLYSNIFILVNILTYTFYNINTPHYYFKLTSGSNLGCIFLCILHDPGMFLKVQIVQLSKKMHVLILFRLDCTITHSEFQQYINYVFTLTGFRYQFQETIYLYVPITIIFPSSFQILIILWVKMHMCRETAVFLVKMAALLGGKAKPYHWLQTLQDFLSMSHSSTIKLSNPDVKLLSLGQ